MLSHVRALMHLATALVPVLLALMLPGPTTTLLYVFFGLLLASYPAVASVPAQEAHSLQNFVLEMWGIATIVLDAQYLQTERSHLQVRCITFTWI